MKLYNIILLLVFSQSALGVERVSEISMAKSEVPKVYLTPGLVGVLILPKNVQEVRIGNQKDFKVVISDLRKNELTLAVEKSGIGKRTNLLVRANEYLLAFDLISSNREHQDIIRINYVFEGKSTKGLTLKKSYKLGK